MFVVKHLLASCLLLQYFTSDCWSNAYCIQVRLISDLTIRIGGLVAEMLVTKVRRLTMKSHYAGTRLGEERPAHRQMPLWAQALLLLAFWAAFLLLQVPSHRQQPCVYMA